MDMQQNTPVQQMPSPSAGAEKKSSMGSVVGAVIIIIVIILGGLYFWGAQLEEEAAQDDTLPFILGDNSYVDEGLPPVSSSDEVTDIETDAAATNMAQFEAALDADMRSTETELGNL